MKKWLFIVLGLAIVTYFGARIFIDVMSHRPAALGVTEGQLVPCPDSPNCVSTQADPADEQHYIEPMTYTGESAVAMDNMIEAIESMKGSEIITREPNYIYAEYTTAMMHYIDDVEVYIDDTEKQIHLRSASRLGHSDLGKNRARLEELINAYNSLK